MGVSWERYTCTLRKTCYFFVSWDTSGPSSRCEELLFIYFFNLYTNVQRVKRDIFTADIYYYITTEFGYAKRDLRLAAYGGVVLQRFEFIKVCMGKNGSRHYS